MLGSSRDKKLYFSYKLLYRITKKENYIQLLIEDWMIRLMSNGGPTTDR
jgi:hypothetical protein